MSKEKHKDGLTLRLVVTEGWFDEIESGRKRVEYRRICPHWKRLIWDRKEWITRVVFQRAFKKNPAKAVFEVSGVDIGECPSAGWEGQYYRVCFRAQKEGEMK